MNMDESFASSQQLQNGNVVYMKRSIENEEEVVATMESDSPSTEQTHKYAALISNYEDVNEKLRRELNELKTRQRESKSEQVVNPEENADAMKELIVVQNLIEARNRAFIENRLEAALWHKATSMFETESTTRRLIQGMLKHRTGLAKLKKNTWVEIHFSTGKAYKNEYEPGFVMLTYADSKYAETFNQCQVIEIFVRESSSKDVTFTVRVSSEGTEKELMFGFETEIQRNEWVNCITSALNEVNETYTEQKEHYTLQLEFAKEKIGLLIKERFLRKCNANEISSEEYHMVERTKSGQFTKKDSEQAIEVKVEEEELPCELLVIEIVDTDLSNSGLQVDSIVKAINDTVLVGKKCSEQLKLLSQTPKPFMLTFTGRNFKKMTAPLKSCPMHAYFSVLKELVSFGDNEVKDAFKGMVTGTLFERELKSSQDENKSISKLLGNQRRLIDLLQNYTAKAGKQQEEQEYKE